MLTAVADPGFPWGGCQLQSGGANLLLRKMLEKMQESIAERVPSTPGPANVLPRVVLESCVHLIPKLAMPTLSVHYELLNSN